MPVVLAAHSYGKSHVRLTKVTRLPDRHELTEWSVDVQLGGDFAPAYTTGDNRLVVPTDTMKNRVYILARDHDFTSPEEFALHYARDFLNDYQQVASATVFVAEQPWQRIAAGGSSHPHAFVAGPAGERICDVTLTRQSRNVTAGLRDLPILKSTDSAFRDFHRDQYTTLPDTDDRILATLLTAAWSYANGDHDWNKLYAQIKERLLAVFAAHRSLGVQHTLHAMGAAVLESIPVAEEIELKMPNRHRILFNMEPFGRVNPDQVYVTTDEPFGTISARLRRQ